ncbi:MAG TPA: hypothetical protein VLK23_01570 [Thermodesulfobacteriota bacterium]|nr:hypothetical protein [Thermodesulfobacteriota bacterium]
METILINKRFLEDFISGWARILYHIALAALSAAIALSLPRILNFIAKEILVYWSIFRNEKLLVVSIEMTVAILLVIFFNVVGRSWRDRRLSNMARDAGLVLVKPLKGFFSRRRTKKLKEKQGFAKDVLVIGSTGFRTFVDPKGDLHHVMQNCRMAKIMLLNPFREGARVRAQSILDPHVTPETFQEQIKRSIAFLKGLKAVKKEVKLKLYQDAPLLKLAILDDYIWIQHYHAGLDIQRMPEYVFKHDQNLSSLYIPFYQYFMTRWNDPNVPEYDLEADMLIYRDMAGNEIRREKFSDQESEIASRNIPDRLAPKHGHGHPSKRIIYPLRQNRKTLACIDEDFKNVW